MSFAISRCAIIPARFASSRFPGKPLVHLLGKPMIQHTYEQTLRAATLEKVWIATDDARIARCAEGFGAPVLLTSPTCANGTERLVEALQQLPELADDAIVVNVQGDEPLIDPSVIDAVVGGLQSSEAPMATASTPLQREEDYLSRSVVKCVSNRAGLALYFSRAALGTWGACQGENASVRRHVGIYAFRRWFLERYAKMEPTPLQITEDLEQLRVLEHGWPLQIIPLNHDALGVDTPQDVARAEERLRARLERLMTEKVSP
jgi:3-deoxy-manno-octulosonate cytidylyltransferase (CMP-KDO synthetase)